MPSTRKTKDMWYLQTLESQ